MIVEVSAPMRQVMLVRLIALTLMLSRKQLQWQRAEHSTSEQMIDLMDEELSVPKTLRFENAETLRFLCRKR